MKTINKVYSILTLAAASLLSGCATRSGPITLDGRTYTEQEMKEYTPLMRWMMRNNAGLDKVNDKLEVALNPGKTQTNKQPEEIMLPFDLTQYLENKDNVLTAVPLYPNTSQNTSIQISQYPTNKVLQYQRIRASYGGIYPYTVVSSEMPYIIVNQDDDVLIVGMPQPNRQILQQKPAFILSTNNNNQLVATPAETNPANNVAFFENRIKVGFKAPPGVPNNVVKTIDLGKDNYAKTEARYYPNQSKAYPLQDKVAYLNGTKFEVYKTILP
jgi:hypothetical protein